jgi:hypothetical protein
LGNASWLDMARKRGRDDEKHDPFIADSSREGKDEFRIALTCYFSAHRYQLDTALVSSKDGPRGAHASEQAWRLFAQAMVEQGTMVPRVTIGGTEVALQTAGLKAAIRNL